MFTLSLRASLVISMLLALLTPVAAQDHRIRLSAVTLGSGESPTTSGPSATVTLTTEQGQFLDVNAQQETAWVRYGRLFHAGKTTVQAGGSVAVFQGAPSASPYLFISVPITEIGGQKVSASVMEWPGVFLGRRPTNWDKPGVPWVSWFTLAQLNIGGLGMSFGDLKFLNEPNNGLPGVSYTHGIRKDIQVTGSVTWNSNAGHAMYYFGGTWSPTK